LDRSSASTIEYMTNTYKTCTVRQQLNTASKIQTPTQLSTEH
jgi:hypothetical protein